MSSTALDMFYDTSALATHFYGEPESDQVELATVSPEHADVLRLDVNRLVGPPTRLL